MPMIFPAPPKPAPASAKSSAKGAAHASVKRDHQAALKAGAPRVPRGYFWSALSKGGFSLSREVEADTPGAVKLSYVGELDENGNWTPIHGEQFNPFSHPTPARKSARITTDSPTPRLKVLPSDSLPSGSGSKTYPPVADGLPKLDGVQWEHKDDGSIEAWHAPDGARKRAGKTYLGRVGKRLLAKWQAEPSDKLPEIVAAWIAEKRARKSIT